MIFSSTREDLIKLEQHLLVVQNKIKRFKLYKIKSRGLNGKVQMINFKLSSKPGCQGETS